MYSVRAALLTFFAQGQGLTCRIRLFLLAQESKPLFPVDKRRGLPLQKNKRKEIVMSAQYSSSLALQNVVRVVIVRGVLRLAL